MLNCIGLLLATAIRMHSDINFTMSDFNLMCRCVMAEDSDLKGQEAVATVILNRVYCEDKFPNTVEGVITQEKQFSIASSGERIPEDVRYVVAFALLKHGTIDQEIPRSCYYFRAGTYHDFGIQYRKIGGNYFSLAENATD